MSCSWSKRESRIAAECGSLIGWPFAAGWAQCHNRYRAGSTINVRIVDEMIPPITTVASGRCTSRPSRSPGPLARSPARPRELSSAPGGAASTNRAGSRRQVAPFAAQLIDERHHHETIEHRYARQGNKADGRRDRKRNPANTGLPLRIYFVRRRCTCTWFSCVLLPRRICSNATEPDEVLD